MVKTIALIAHDGQKKKMLEWVEKGGFMTILALAIIGIACAIIGLYGTTGFDLKWFLFLHLPLYIFIAWAFFKIAEIIKKFNNQTKH